MTGTEHWLTLPTEAHPGEIVIGTLGPAGTSSEAAARALHDRLGQPAECAGRINLYGTYEEAAAALRRLEISYLLVANAYAAINEFYMDPRISLAGAFVMDTPEYGVACRPGQTVSRRPRIATHPAPRPLLLQLLPFLPQDCADSEILQVASTSAAAKAAYDEIVDLALTTVPAAELYGLEFISPRRTIRMVWSAFGSSE